LATEVIKGKLLGVDRIGENETALVIEVHAPMKPVEHRKISTKGYVVTPDWVVKNMGYEVECMVANGVLKSVLRSH
jgi:hypothetical protein